MSRVIAIANQKGGVGKTTTAVNLSASLAEAGERTLLIDMDPQGNSTSGLGIKKDELRLCCYDFLIGQCSLTNVVSETPMPLLSLLPATISLAGAEVELVNEKEREYRLKKALSGADEFAYIIIDCPPSLGLLTLNALCAASSLLIPIQCEFYALEGVSQLLRTVNSVRSSLNPSLYIEGALLTMIDSRLNLNAQVADEVRKYFGDRVYQTCIPRNVRLSEAPGYGLPVLLYDPRSRGAACYRELASEVRHNAP